MKNEVTCHYCDENFEYEDNDTATAIDTVEGQRIEFETVLCPHCELHIQI